MFKLKIIPRFKSVNVRATKGDVIICNLPDSDNMEFYVNHVTAHGVIIGSYMKRDVGLYTWLFGENYNILCNIIST